MSFEVVISDLEDRLEVSILEDGSPALRRACSSAEEAEVFASTVRQHLAWLSEERFRAYYRL